MKPLLLHGPAVNNSRIKLSALKQKFPTNNVVIFDEGSKIDEILGSLITQSIFEEERLVILENPPDDFSPDLSLLTSHLSLVLWFDHQVHEKKPLMEWIKKNGQVMFFPEVKEVSIFPLLDYLANKDEQSSIAYKKAFLELKKLKKEGFDIFYFITMTFYLLRNLVVTPKTAPPFVKSKLEKQRKNFNLEKIKTLYKDVLEIEFKLKKGLLDIKQAEFLLISKFIN